MITTRAATCPRVLRLAAEVVIMDGEGADRPRAASEPQGNGRAGGPPAAAGARPGRRHRRGPGQGDRLLGGRDHRQGAPRRVGPHGARRCARGRPPRDAPGTDSRRDDLRRACGDPRGAVGPLLVADRRCPAGPGRDRGAPGKPCADTLRRPGACPATRGSARRTASSTSARCRTATSRSRPTAPAGTPTSTTPRVRAWTTRPTATGALQRRRRPVRRDVQNATCRLGDRTPTGTS